MQNPEYPRRLHHRTPTWVASDALFHIRIRVNPIQELPLTNVGLASELIDAAQRYHASGHFCCELFLLMPDHLHAMLRFAPERGMTLSVKNWKQGTARFQKVHWQDNFFDHRIRSRQEAQEKWHYIRMNPVVKGLCAHEEDWPHWWSGTLGGAT